MAAEREVEAGAYRPYRDVLADSARGVAARLGWRLDPARASFLADSVPSWVPFPDTNAALERLRAAGYALGILSNVDDDLLAEHAGTSPWTSSWSSPRSRCGRTSPRARTSTPPAGPSARAPGSTSARATSTTWCPARAQGIPNAWINRNGDAPDDGGKVDREFPTLRELADWLVAR